MRSKTTKEQALILARDSVQAEPEIQKVFFFPSDEEVRLIEIDPTTSPSKNGKVVTPFYFGRDIKSGLSFPSAIALIRPEEFNTHHPPKGWGDWADAEVIWEAHQDAG